MQRGRIIAGVAIGLLLLGSLVAAFLHPPALEVARGHCSEHGFQAENLAVLDYRGSGNLFCKRETVEFQVKGASPPKKLVVELHQAAYFLPWQVVELRQE